MNEYNYNLGQLFNNISSKRKSDIALRFKEKNYTFKELNSLSNRIANYLTNINIQEEDVVAILNNKTIESYAIMIACLKIGAIYTNIDPKSPAQRFNKMLLVCEPKIIFYFKKQELVNNEFTILETICFDEKKFKDELKEFSPQTPICINNTSGDKPAYIMFTSGSTGFPKGVVISHSSVINFINWAKQTYNITKNDVFTNINPMHFDNSVFDFYSSLFNGASLIPVDEKLTRNPKRLIEHLNVLSPTIWFSVPSMLVYILNLRALKKDDLPTLRIVTFGGEGFPKNQLRQLWRFWGYRITFINVYGPTECTCICSSYIVNEKDLESDELLPIGQMAPNFYKVILDKNGFEVENGKVGELCIGGSNVGIGYYNNKEKTSEVFIENPMNNSYRELIYKSGDLVKEKTFNGILHFCGRIDNQIKRMGYRIELEEIENAFNSIAFIEESAVVFIENEKYKSKIIACIRTKNKEENKIKDLLKKRLPLYMMPDYYFFLENLPKNQNGKINRLKLKESFNI